MSPPPNGDVSNGPVIVGLAVGFGATAAVFVTMRTYIRIFITQNFWWDDGLVVLGLALSITGTTFNCIMVSHGGGRHRYYLDVEDAFQILKWNTLFAIFNVLCTTVVKASILLLIFRLQSSPRWCRFIYFMLAYVIGLGFGTAILMCVQCVPLNVLWNPTVQGKCISREVYGNVSAAHGVLFSAADLIMTVMPIVLLWKIQLPTRVKITICVLMGLGLAATAFLIMRIVYFRQLSADDFSYDCWGVDIAAQMEQNICIIAACIPTLKPVLQLAAYKIKSISSNFYSDQQLNFGMQPLSGDERSARQYLRGSEDPHIPHKPSTTSRLSQDSHGINPLDNGNVHI